MHYYYIQKFEHLARHKCKTYGDWLENKLNDLFNGKKYIKTRNLSNHKTRNSSIQITIREITIKANNNDR